MNNVYDLIIIVYGCDTIPKYKNQILKIEETYGKLINQDPNVKLLYFLGEEIVLNGVNFIHLKNVKNDYNSASIKQWHGLKYCYENYDFKFVMCIGTDTYLNIKKLKLFLEHYDYNKSLYIGGHGCNRQLDKNIYFHSGGPGFILSKNCLEIVYPYIKNPNEIIKYWNQICNLYYKPPNRLKPACDVAMGYLVSINENEIETIISNNFHHCNYKGAPCHRGEVNMENILSCHNMSIKDFDDYTDILNKNNYFL